MLGPVCYAAERADPAVGNAGPVQLDWSFVSYLTAWAHQQTWIFSAVEELQTPAFAEKVQGSAPDLTGSRGYLLEMQT